MNPFDKARYLREQFEEQNPRPKYCGVCYFLEDWDSRAPGQEPRLCIDCAGAIRYWYKKMDKFLEEHGKRNKA